MVENAILPEGIILSIRADDGFWWNKYVDGMLKNDKITGIFY